MIWKSGAGERQQKKRIQKRKARKKKKRRSKKNRAGKIRKTEGAGMIQQVELSKKDEAKEVELKIEGDLANNRAIFQDWGRLG